MNCLNVYMYYISAVKRLITSKIKVYIMCVCVLCICIHYVYILKKHVVYTFKIFINSINYIHINIYIKKKYM